jgi:hypothetical protein
MYAANASADQYLSSYPEADLFYSVASGHHYLKANKNFEAGTVITSFRASEILDKPDRYTVQKSGQEHITLDPPYLRYMNHSCAPNCFFDMERMELVALKPIRLGETLNFFYPSTEWEMAEPFQCLCGTANCLGTIRGANNLPAEILKEYRLSPFIANQIHP